jgi:branched-chain amino acid aminotransferase
MSTGTETPTACWVNGERQPLDGPHVSARDRGFTLADGVFETMRAYDGVIFRLDRHLARLEHALGALEIPVRPELREWVLAAARAAEGGDAGIRLTVTRGIGSGGLAPPAAVHPTVVVAVSPLPEFPRELYDVGLAAHIASGVRNERAMTARLKTVAYTDAIAALVEARRAGANEALFLDTEAHCSEATSSNLFAVTSSRLLTPPISCGALPGITRAVVLELAAARGLPSAERAFGLDELLAADEAFLTSSLRGIAPIVRVGGRAIGSGRPGACTREIAAAYAAIVAAECGR